VFSIFDVAIGDAALALCPLPGRFSPYLNDFAAILAWRPDLVLSLTERSEMKPVGAADFPADLKAQGIQCCHFPILDYQTPKPENAKRWQSVEAKAGRMLGQGGRVLVHCFGGCGRSGMVALRLMRRTGLSADVALSHLRAIRPGAIETPEQERWARVAFEE